MLGRRRHRVPGPRIDYRGDIPESPDAIQPGHSGLVALVSDPGAIRIRKALERADAIVESAIDKVEADDIKAAAKEAQQTDA